MRKQDIDEYLTEAREIVSNLKAKYLSKDLNSVSSLDKAKVFNCINLLRSVLDYCFFDVVELVITPTVDKKHDDKLQKKLDKGKIYFPYYSENKTRFQSELLHEKLFKADKDLFDIFESFQPYNDPQSKTIYNLCNISNKLKHDNSYQNKTSSTVIKIGKPTKKEPNGIFKRHKNVVVEGPIKFSGVSIIESENITLTQIECESIQIRDSKNVLLFAGSFNHLESSNSDIKLAQNTIQGKKQLQTIRIANENVTISAGNYITINGKTVEAFEIETHNLSIIDETKFTFKGLDLNILDFLSEAHMLVTIIVEKVYKKLL